MNVFGWLDCKKRPTVTASTSSERPPTSLRKPKGCLRHRRAGEHFRTQRRFPAATAIMTQMSRPASNSSDRASPPGRSAACGHDLLPPAPGRRRASHALPRHRNPSVACSQPHAKYNVAPRARLCQWVVSSSDPPSCHTYLLDLLITLREQEQARFLRLSLAGPFSHVSIYASTNHCPLAGCGR